MQPISLRRGTGSGVCREAGDPAGDGQLSGGVESGDLDGHVALYTDSAAMMGRNGPVPGRGTIRGILERGFWTNGKPNQQLDFSELVVIPLGTNFAMLTGKCTLTGGGRPDFTCRFTTIWEKRPNGWRIIHDHSS